MPINPPIAGLVLLTLASGNEPAQPPWPTPVKRPMADSIWEDSMPRFVPAKK